MRKLRLIAVSDLADFDKLRYVLNDDARDRARACSRTGCEAATSVTLRQGTTDFKVFDEIFVERAYAPCVAALPDHLARSR